MDILSTISVFLFLGIASAFQPQLHYEYDYTGSTTSGIEEISGRRSGWAMKSKLHVYVDKGDGTAILQLKDFKQTEFIDDLGPHESKNIPDEEYKSIPMDDVAKAIEAPIKVNLFGKEKFAIENTIDEKNMWLSNCKKATANLLINEILKANSDFDFDSKAVKAMQKGHVINSFSAMEPMIVGTCKTDYTIHKIPEKIAMTKRRELRKQMESDAQTIAEKSQKRRRRRRDDFELSNDLWHVVRSVDFDHCRQKVASQSILTGVTDDINTSQYEWVRGRSSVTEYTFRGTPGHMRLENLELVGATTMVPFALKTDEILKSTTKQALKLVKVSKIEDVPKLVGETTKIKTWSYQYMKFVENHTPGANDDYFQTHEKQKVGHLLSIFGSRDFTEKELDSTMQFIYDSINNASLHMTDFYQEMAVDEMAKEFGPMYQLRMATYALSQVPDEKKVLKLFEKFFAKDLHQSDQIAKKMVIDVAAASGSDVPMRAIIKYLKEDRIPHLQVMTLFMGFASNQYQATFISSLMEYVLSLDLKTNPFVTSTILVNFAQILNKMCIRSIAENKYHSASYYDMTCDKESIKNRFLPHLKTIVENPDSSEWQKDVAITAINTLGTPLSIPILIPVIQGKFGCNSRTRSMAIYALNAWRQDQARLYGPQIVDLLTDIYSNIEESPAVREAAIGALWSWGPSPSFFYHIARLSWTEPSKHMSVFMSSFLKSVANFEHPFYVRQNQAAYHASKLAKPVVPSLKYAYVVMMASRLADIKASKFSIFSYHSSEDQNSAKGLYYYLMSDFGGISMTNLELSLSTEGISQVMRKVIKNYGSKVDLKSAASKVAKDVFDGVMGALGAKSVPEKPKNIKTDIFLRIFDHMNLYLPFNKETLSTLPLSDPTNIGALGVQLALGYPLELAKYTIPVDVKSVAVNELGLPVFVSFSAALLFAEPSFTTVSTPAADIWTAARNSEVNVEALSQVYTMTIASMATYLPWNMHMNSVSATNSKSIILPLMYTLKAEKEDDEMEIALEVESMYKQKFTPFKVSNYPLVSLTSIIDGSYKKFKFLHAGDLKETKTHYPGTFTGLSGDVIYSSDGSFPYSRKKVMKFFKSKTLSSPLLLHTIASPTIRFWKFQLKHDPAQSKTKKIVMEFSYNKHEEEAHSSEEVDDEEEINFVNSGEDEPEPFEFDDSNEKRSDKVKKLFGGDPYYSNHFKVKFDGGDESRIYGLHFTNSQFKSTKDRLVREGQFAFVRSPIPGFDDVAASMCLDMSMSSPKHGGLSNVKNSDRKVKVELKIGCKGDSILTEEAIASVPFSEYDSTKLEDPESVFYDFSANVSWKTVPELKRFPLTHKMLRAMEKIKFVFSDEENCGCEHQKHRYQYKLHRCPLTHEWKQTINGDLMEEKVHELGVDEDLDTLMNVGWHDRLSNHHTDDFCQISVDSVNTFDDLEYDFDMSPCWTVATTDKSSSFGKMILVRLGENKRPDLKIVGAGYVIEYVDSKLKVNEAEIALSQWRTNLGDNIGFASYTSDCALQVRFNDGYFVIANEKVKIDVPETMHGVLGGLCGNFDGEKVGDLVGPLGCLYDCPCLHARSWHVDGEKCVSSDFKKWSKKVEDYQKDCINVAQFYESCPKYNGRDIQPAAWKIEKYGEDICLSASPVPRCDENCQYTTETFMPVNFNCWNSKYWVPEPIKKASDAGNSYVEQPPIAYLLISAAYSMSIKQEIPTACKNF